MSGNADNAVTIVIDFNIYAYLFKPIIGELVERGVKVFVFCPSEIMASVADDIGFRDRVEMRSLDPIKKKHLNRWRLHRSLLILCTRADFSFQFAKKRGQITKKYAGMQGILLRLARFTPKVPNRSTNAFLHAVMGIGLRNPFPTRKILVGSLNASAELLCAKDQLVYTVMESWDHPVKEPNGYRSHRVYAWNRELGEDWEATQRDKNWVPAWPLKLRYARHEVMEKGLWEKARGKRARPMCVYAVASTQRFSMGIICEMEDRILADLTLATREAGWDLFIKPRPNGIEGEFDKFRAGNPHVSVGSLVDEPVNVPANYTLDDAYNKRRFMELIEADLVVNAFTTFGLDAMSAGIPVLQLDLRDAPGYEKTRLIFRNYHIDKYLLGTPGTFAVKDESFAEKMTAYLRSPGDLAARYRDNLAARMFPDRSMADSLRMMVDGILGDAPASVRTKAPSAGSLKYAVTHCYTDRNKGDAAIVIATAQLIRSVDPGARINFYSTFGPRDGRLDTDHRIIRPYADNLYPGFFYQPEPPRLLPIDALRGLAFSLILLKGLLLLLSANAKFTWLFLTPKEREGIKELLDSDVIISKGGSYLTTQNRSLRQTLSLITMLYPFLFARRHRKKIVIFSQSLGPLEGGINKRLFAAALAKVEAVYPRESLCIRQYPEVREAVERVHSKVVPDTAFALEDEGGEPPVRFPEGRLKVGLTLVDHAFKYMPTEAERRQMGENYKRSIIAAVTHLLENRNASVHIFPQVTVDNSHLGHNDTKLSREVAAHFATGRHAGSVRFHEGDFTPGELKRMYGGMDLFIGTRLHSVIFSLSRCVPSVVISYHGTKARGIFGGIEGFGKFVLDINTITAQSLIDAVEDLHADREGIKAVLAKSGVEFRASLRDAMADVCRRAGLARAPQGGGG